MHQKDTAGTYGKPRAAGWDTAHRRAPTPTPRSTAMQDLGTITPQPRRISRPRSQHPRHSRTSQNPRRLTHPPSASTEPSYSKTTRANRSKQPTVPSCSNLAKISAEGESAAWDRYSFIGASSAPLTTVDGAVHWQGRTPRWRTRRRRPLVAIARPCRCSTPNPTRPCRFHLRIGRLPRLGRRPPLGAPTTFLPADDEPTRICTQHGLRHGNPRQ